jgi:putative DNA primase/helicase
VKVAPEPYPLDALPDGIRQAVEEVQSFVQAPAALVSLAALAALSASAQALYNVHRADKLTGPIGLFLLSIADSGERKSTCDSFFRPAIREYEKQQAIARRTDVEKYRAAAAAWEATRTGLLTAIREAAKSNKSTAVYEAQLQKHEGLKPQEPRVPKILLGDSTPEHLAFSLAHRWPSGAVISAEGGLIFGSHAMGTDSIMRSLALFNTLWDGAAHDIGRRTSESYTVRGARLTVALQVQEVTLREFFERSSGLARGTGFMARFLISWPESTQGLRQFVDPPPRWPALAAFQQRVAEILGIDPRLDAEGALMPDMLMPSPDAKVAWREFHDSVERELKNGGALRDLRDVASKAADNAARLAALFHVFDMGKSAPKGSAGRYISAAHMQGAARIVRWHMHEARRFFGELALPDELALAVRLDGWLIDYCRRERVRRIAAHKVQQLAPAGLRKREVLEKVVAALDDMSRARMVREGRAKFIVINPALLDLETLR